MSLSRLAVCVCLLLSFGLALVQGCGSGTTAPKQQSNVEATKPEDLGTLLPPPSGEPGAPAQQQGAKP